MEDVNFLTGGERYGLIIAKFKKEKMAKKYSRKLVNTKVWALYPMSMGKHFARIHVGRVGPGIKPEWVDLEGIEIETEIV